MEIESEVDPKIIVVENCQGLKGGNGPLEVPNGVEYISTAHVITCNVHMDCYFMLILIL